MNYNTIENKAIEQFELHGRKIPVSVVEIAQSLNLVIHDVEMSEVEGVTPSGALTKIDNQWVILVNQNDLYTRKRFTIAHEIGHYLLHKGEDFVDVFSAGETFYRNGENSQKEKEANYFAANLLMPASELTKLWPKFQNPAQVAEFFKVSEVSMTFRLKNLKLVE